MNEDTAQGRSWSTGQLGAYIDYVRDDRLLALWLLIATTGLTLRTLTTLRRDEVDLHERRLIPRSGPTTLDEAKDGQASEGYALDPDTYDALRNHVIAWDKADDQAPRSGRLFTDVDGGDLTPADITSMFRRKCAEANLPAVPFREVRQAYVIAALETGIPTRVLRERLGNLDSPSLGVGRERKQLTSRTQASVAHRRDRGSGVEQSGRHLRSIR